MPKGIEALNGERGGIFSLAVEELEDHGTVPSLWVTRELDHLAKFLLTSVISGSCWWVLFPGVLRARACGALGGPFPSPPAGTTTSPCGGLTSINAAGRPHRQSSGEGSE